MSKIVKRERICDYCKKPITYSGKSISYYKFITDRNNDSGNDACLSCLNEILSIIRLLNLKCFWYEKTEYNDDNKEIIVMYYYVLKKTFYGNPYYENVYSKIR